MRHQPFRLAAAAASAAVALAVCGGAQAAAARTSSSRPDTAAAVPSGCVSIITAEPRALPRGAVSTVSAGSRAFGLPGTGSFAPAAGRPARLSEAWPGLAEARTARALAEPTGAGDTVTVIGTTIAGQPARQSDQVFLFNASDSAKFDNPAQSIQGFTAGVARFTVPAGQYWALGEFVKQLPKQQSLAVYLDVLPQFKVGGNTTMGGRAPVRAESLCRDTQ
jgi:hypothetical protein